MTCKQRETLQRVIGIIWTASFNKDVGDPLDNAIELLDELLDDDRREETNETD